MIPIIYEKTEKDFDNNGLGRLRDMIRCLVVEERNGIYEVDFEYPVDGQNFELIQPGRIILCPHDDTGDMQPFDIVSYSRPINGVVSFHGVHISYRLNYIVRQAKNINTLQDALDILQGPLVPIFNYSADFSASAFVASFDGVPKTSRQYLGGVEGSILDTFGGEYEFDRFNVILHESRGERKDFAIRYGVNLIDYTNETDYAETYNKAAPYWIGQNAKGEEICVSGDTADPGLPCFMEMPRDMPLDLSEKFETKPTPAQLKAEAEKYMLANKVNEPAETITVNFARLADFEDFAELAGLLGCRLCDTVRVIFPQYKEDRWLKIVRTEYDVLAERFESMELGKLGASLSDALGISPGGSFSESDVLGGLFKITKMDVTVPITAAHANNAASDYTIPASARVDGYNLAAIAGVQTSNFRINSQTHYIKDQQTIRAAFSNTTATATTAAATYTFYLLWLKGTKAT